MFGVRRCKFVLRKGNISLQEETVVDSEYSVVTESYFLNRGSVRIKGPNWPHHSPETPVYINKHI